ncbi:MAG: DUF87 domain-containing protein [Chloroflexota bacterium]
MLNPIIPLEAAAPMSSDVLHLDVEGKLPLTVQSFSGQRVAILGTSGMGKTNTLALILEKTLPFIPSVIFDQHDEYWGLCEQYELLRVGKSPESQIKCGPEMAEKIAEISHSKRLSVLVEMLDMTPQERQDFVELYCARIWELNKRVKLPYGIVLEEAQNFIPEGKMTPAQAMMKQFALEGRKFGFSIFISTQRSAEVSKTVLGQCGLSFLHGVEIYADMQAYAGMLPYSTAETKKIAMNLGVGECIVKVKTDGRAQFIHPVKMCRRETFHVGDTPTLDQDTAPPLRAIDAELLRELKDLLKPAPAKGHVADKPLQEIGMAHDAHVDSYIADLQAKLGAANAEITRLKTGKACLAPSSEWQPSAAVIAHAGAVQITDVIKGIPPGRVSIGKPPAVPGADVQLNTTSDVWDGRSPLATQRARNKQQREFDSLIQVIRDMQLRDRRVLVYLTMREEMTFVERDLVRYLGYSLSAFQNQRPVILEKRGLVQRKLVQGKYVYKSTVRSHFEATYPDLEIEPMVEQIKQMEKI